MPKSREDAQAAVRNKLIGQIRTLLDYVQIKDGVHTSISKNDAEKTCETALKYGSTDKYLDTHDVYFRLLVKQYLLLSKRSSTKDGYLKDVLPHGLVEEMANELADELDTLPRSYLVYFETSLILPEDQTEIIINDTLRLVRPPSGSGILYSMQSETASPTLGVKEKAENISDAVIQRTSEAISYLECKVSGYAYTGTPQESAIRTAYLHAKRFLYAAVTTGCISHMSWKQPGSNRKSAFFADDRLGVQGSIEGKVVSVSLSPALESFLCTINLNTSPVPSIATQLGAAHPNQSTGQIIQERINASAAFLDKLPALSTPIGRAVEWAFQGMINGDHEYGFVQTCIALEAVLGEGIGKDETGGVTFRLADRCAYLLGTSQKNREYIRDEMIKIYALRSQIVHGSKMLDNNGEKLVMKAELMLQNIIRKEVRMIDE